MPRKKRTLKPIDEARALLEAQPKRKQRSSAEVQREREQKAEAQELARLAAKGITPAMLEALGFEAAVNTPHFLCDGMVSSIFFPRPGREPAIPYLRHAPELWDPVDYITRSYAYDWWKKEVAKEKAARDKGEPLYQTLCKRWTAINTDSEWYIDKDQLNLPAANGRIYRHEVPVSEQNAFLACCPALDRFLTDIGASQEGYLPTRHLLKEWQRQENDYYRSLGLEMQKPFYEHADQDVQLTRPDPSQPYGPDNFEIEDDLPVFWVPVGGKQRDREIPLRQIQLDLKDFIFAHGYAAVKLIRNLKAYGDTAALETVAPLFNSETVARTRTAFVGSIDRAAEIFDTTPELLEAFNGFPVSQRREELTRLHREKYPENRSDLFSLRLAWPNCYWNEVCPPKMLREMLKEHITLHQPWRLPQAEAEALIGPELYRWLKQQYQAKRVKAWDAIRLFIALEGSYWWRRDWIDAEAKLDPCYFQVIMPNDKALWGLNWRRSTLETLLYSGRSLYVLNRKTHAPLEERDELTVEDTRFYRRLLPKHCLDVWSETIRAFGAYALQGGLDCDWWLEATIKRTQKEAPKGWLPRAESEKRIDQPLEERLLWKRHDYEDYAVGPAGQTRPVAPELREAWEKSLRTLVRWCAGEPGETVYDQGSDKDFEALEEALWQYLLPITKGDSSADTPKLDLLARPLWDMRNNLPGLFIQVYDLMNRNRQVDAEWGAKQAALDEEAREKEQEESNQRAAIEEERLMQKDADLWEKIRSTTPEGQDKSISNRRYFLEKTRNYQDLNALEKELGLAITPPEEV